MAPVKGEAIVLLLWLIERNWGHDAEGAAEKIMTLINKTKGIRMVSIRVLIDSAESV